MSTSEGILVNIPHGDECQIAVGIYVIIKDF